MDWDVIWTDAIRKSPFNVYNSGNLDWGEFWDAYSEHYFRDSLCDEPLRRNVVDYLRNNGALLGDDDVLDVGCGPGTYSMIFAEMVKRVDGLDISGGMLRQMQSEASIRGLGNIYPILSSWDDFHVNGMYDLVFSSFSPAVFNPKTLLKMEKYSRRACCYVTNGGSYTRKLRDQLWEMITGEDNVIDPYDAIYPFNFLYSTGRKPDVKFFMMESAFTSSADTLIINFLKVFNTILKIDEDQENIIRKYILSHSKNGVYEQNIKEMIAVINWKV